MRHKCIETFTNAGAPHHLAANGCVTVLQGIDAAKRQPVDVTGVGQLIIERFLQGRGLGHTEAAKGAGDRSVGMNGSSLSKVVGCFVGT